MKNISRKLFAATLLCSVFLNGANYAESQSYPYSLCNDVESKSALLRLRRYLFCDYDQLLRPTADYRNATTIRFGVIPRTIQVDDSTNVLNLHAWTTLIWRDAHLTWDPSSYENIRWFQVKSYEIWVPDLAVHSASNVGANEEMSFTSCWLFFNGGVYCVPAGVYATHCTADHAWWPYDSISCIIEFGSWSYSVHELQFRLLHSELRQGRLTMDKYQENPEWDVIRYYMTQRVEMSKFGKDMDSQLISYHIILKRHGSMFNSVYVVPIAVLMLLTLLTLWLEPRSLERMIVANLNFICHLLTAPILMWRIPYNGSHPPRLILLYQCSLVLSCLSLILTSLFRHIQKLNTDVPAWLSTSTTSVLRSKIGRIFLISILDPKVSARIEINAEDNADLMSSRRKGAAWEFVSILFGWIAFLTVTIAYVVILALYLPTSTSGGTVV